MFLAIFLGSIILSGLCVYNCLVWKKNIVLYASHSLLKSSKNILTTSTLQEVDHHFFMELHESMNALKTPQLHMAGIQKSLQDVENSVHRYNNAVKDFNHSLHSFPMSVVASLLRMKPLTIADTAEETHAINFSHERKAS